MMRVDPIRENYFNEIERFDKISTVLYFIGATLSFASITAINFGVNDISKIIQIIFLINVLAIFGIDVWVRLSLSPRAAEARNKDFIANAFNQPITSDRTSGYYNNRAKHGVEKIAAQVFENTLFTKEICRGMLRRIVPLSLFYIALFLVVMITREVSLSIIGFFAQILFSEQILARGLRLYWLMKKCENIHEEMRRLYLSAASGVQFEACALDSFVRYEGAKATAGLTLSSKTFDKLNPSLSVKWEKLSKEHNIGAGRE